MNFKVVYLYDGTPYLSYINRDGEYDYPNDEWTEIPPPEGIYSPFYFDGNIWVGASQEEWRSGLKKAEPYSPNKTEMVMAITQMQLTKTVVQLNKTQKQLADNILEVSKKDISIKNLEQQLAGSILEISKKEERIKKLEEDQAQTMLEIAKLKGE